MNKSFVSCCVCVDLFWRRTDSEDERRRRREGKKKSFSHSPRCVASVVRMIEHGWIYIWMQEEEKEEKKGQHWAAKRKHSVLFILFLSHAERSINRSAVAYLIVGFPPSLLLLLCPRRPCEPSEGKIKSPSCLPRTVRWSRIAPRAANRLHDRNDKM